MVVRFVKTLLKRNLVPEVRNFPCPAFARCVVLRVELVVGRFLEIWNRESRFLRNGIVKRQKVPQILPKADAELRNQNHASFLRRGRRPSPAEDRRGAQYLARLRMWSFLMSAKSLKLSRKSPPLP